MALERLISKYEPIGGDEYIGNVGQLWVDLETGYLHLSDGTNGGGNLVVSTDTNGVLTVDTLTLPSGVSMGNSFVHFPSGEDAQIGIISSAGITLMHSDNSTHFTKNVQIDGAEGQFLARQNGGSGAYGGYSFAQDGGHDTGMFSAADGNLQFYNNNLLTMQLQPSGTHADSEIYGTLTLLPLTAQPTGRAGMMAICDGTNWDGGSDGLQHLMMYLNGAWHKVY
jgi:hypothetical protein